MLRGTLIIGLGTFVSRILGMVRDIVTAAMFGMSSGGVMDAFVIAFRLPDVARRIFSDGALGISFIPEFTKLWQQDRSKAWTLLSVMLSWVFVVLTGLVVFGEIVCWIGYSVFPPESKIYLISHLLALMLPYLILICLAAVATASLQTFGNFWIPALVPPILNIIWIVGVLVIAPKCSNDPATQCYIVTICILLAGVIQFAFQLPVLRKQGFRFHPDFAGVRNEINRIFRGLLPQVFGLMSLQIQILTISGIAWLFSGQTDEPIRWLGRIVSFPMNTGAASAIYYSERLYEFPQGLIGLAISTAIYPLLSQHAAKNNFKALSEDLAIGLRILLVLAIPAGAGLMLFYERLSHLLFQRGAFTPSDMFRTADMIFWFGTGVWAFCLLPFLIRAFYVVGDIWTPFRIGVVGCIVNLILGFILIWPMQEQGLALSMSLTAGIQVVALFVMYARLHGHVPIGSIVVTAVRSCAATLIMSFAIALAMMMLPGQDSLADIIHLIVGGSLGVFVFFMVLRFLGGRELGILVRGRVSKTKDQRKNPPIRRKR